MGANIEESIKMASFWTDQIKSRREIEWKVTMAIWAIMIGAITIALKEKTGIWRVSYLFVPAGHILWLRGIYVGIHFEKIQARYWFARASALALDQTVPQNNPPNPFSGWQKWIGFMTHWSCIFQFIVTATLTTIAFMVSSY